MTWKTLKSDVVLVIETFEFRILACITEAGEFRVSDFEFTGQTQPLNTKTYLIPACPG